MPGEYGGLTVIPAVQGRALEPRASWLLRLVVSASSGFDLETLPP